MCLGFFRRGVAFLPKSPEKPILTAVPSSLFTVTMTMADPRMCPASKNSTLSFCPTRKRLS